MLWENIFLSLYQSTTFTIFAVFRKTNKHHTIFCFFQNILLCKDITSSFFSDALASLALKIVNYRNWTDIPKLEIGHSSCLTAYHLSCILYMRMICQSGHPRLTVWSPKSVSHDSLNHWLIKTGFGPLSMLDDSLIVILYKIQWPIETRPDKTKLR